MDETARAAFLQSQTACALIEAMGMAADNQHRIACGHSIAYDGEAFTALIDKYQLGHNSAVTWLHGQ